MSEAHSVSKKSRLPASEDSKAAESSRRALSDTSVQKDATDQEAGTASYEDDDCQSIQSGYSSATLNSTLSGFTVVEVANATVELQRVFQEDANFVGLHRRAIKDVSIGPDRLKRNLARLLKVFARDLRREASEELEKMTCGFVTTKARYISHCIVEELHDRVLDAQSEYPKMTRKLNDGNEDEIHNEIEDLDDLMPIDEDYFQDIRMLRHFLINSAAFQIFQEGLTKFVLPKELRPLVMHSIKPVEKHDQTEDLTSFQRWCSLKRVQHILETAMIATGFLEPSLQPGTIRVRWQCVSRHADCVLSCWL